MLAVATKTFWRGRMDQIDPMFLVGCARHADKIICRLNREQFESTVLWRPIRRQCAPIEKKGSFFLNKKLCPRIDFMPAVVPRRPRREHARQRQGQIWRTLATRT
ncbi:hypothetical protein TW95_gp0528 [Pandoravirus inopinatum]|uniref:Uncharacterized protein n=1 Tax=Pandoravirus inopinatum TaxID=1605721 RepID=A0A0B5JCD1_9VIRU|nr:hypothetical protein TW95_gp0528 [Pandoravirus inopinatum]AJF97262.1 hypothetical protein [Pandoravirus inopinatum]